MSVFLISLIVFFITVYFFFSSCRSLLNIWCIFLIHDFVLFLKFWITFTIMTLNFFRYIAYIIFDFWSCEFYLVPLSGTSFSVFSVFCNLLHLKSSFCKLHQLYSSCFLYLLPVGEVCPVSYVSFVVGGIGSWTLVGRAISCNSYGQRHIRFCILRLSVGFLLLWVACVLISGFVFFSSLLFAMKLPALKPAGCLVVWILEYMWDFRERTWWLIFPVTGNLLVVHCPGLSAPTLKAQVQLLAGEPRPQKLHVE